ncbi:MAG: DUF4180 domain-containing protein [Oscillospiraceae bacterium]
MKITTKIVNKLSYAIVYSEEVIITNVQSALDLIATVKYETDCEAMVLNKGAISEKFFDLKTRIAGEVLQKFVQYDVRLAIVGDFSGYTSKALGDFIYESNRGNHIFFAKNEDEALRLLKSS